jgi:hypothetical protein
MVSPIWLLLNVNWAIFQLDQKEWLSWLWSYSSWIYNYNVPVQSVPKVVSLNPVHGEVYSIQHHVIKFVCDLWQVSGFLTNKTDHHDITEILLKVPLNTINQPTNHIWVAKQVLHKCIYGQSSSGCFLMPSQHFFRYIKGKSTTCFPLDICDKRVMSTCVQLFHCDTTSKIKLIGLVL